MKPYSNKTFAGEPRMNELTKEFEEHLEDCGNGEGSDKPVNWDEIEGKPDFEGMAGVQSLSNEDIQKIWDEVEVN